MHRNIFDLLNKSMLGNENSVEISRNEKTHYFGCLFTRGAKLPLNFAGPFLSLMIVIYLTCSAPRWARPPPGWRWTSSARRWRGGGRGGGRRGRATRWSGTAEGKKRKHSTEVGSVVNAIAMLLNVKGEGIFHFACILTWLITVNLAFWSLAEFATSQRTGKCLQHVYISWKYLSPVQRNDLQNLAQFNGNFFLIGT